MGKIKGPLPKFWILHLWRVGYNANKIELLLVFSFIGLRYGIEWALLMLCLRWLATGLILSSHDVKSSMEVGCTCFGSFWWFIHVWVHWTSFWSFGSLPNEFPKLDPSFPKLGPFPHEQGLLFLTPFLSYFCLSEYPIVIRISRRV